LTRGNVGFPPFITPQRFWGVIIKTKMKKIKCNQCLKEKEEYYTNAGICKECAEKQDKWLEAQND
jgi:predicted amidophosphoribosyltransferase